MATPPGRPCFPHLHLKARLPAALAAEVVYELQLSATNEMDMWDSGDTEGWGATLPVIQLQVLHPHAHAVATPVAGAAASGASPDGSATAASSSGGTGALPPPCASAVLPAPPSLTPAAAALRLHNVAARLAPDCKPLLSRGGKGTLRFLLAPTPAMLARNLALYAPGAPISHPFYLHVSVPGPLGTHILPALSGPHQLFQTGGKGAAGAAAGGTNASGTVSTEKLSYVMGEHGVHHAIFVPLDHAPAPAASGGPGVRGKAGPAGPPVPASVYSFPASALGPHQSPPAFVRFKEILGVNLGGRIWDCGLLLFSYLREKVLVADPFFFHGRKVLEVGSGTGLVGIWLWAYVLLKNRQAAALGERSATGQKRPLVRPTEFLLTDQEEAMDNLRDNISTNLALLTDGAAEMDGARIEASRLSWGCGEDHAALAIQPRPRPFDLVIASDVVFNPIYFTPLLQSLHYISGPGTQVLLAYRPRASDRRQDEVFFRALPKWGWSARREAKYQDVFMLTLTRDGAVTAPEAAAMGVGEGEGAAPAPAPSQESASASSSSSAAAAPAVPTATAAPAASVPAPAAQSEAPVTSVAPVAAAVPAPTVAQATAAPVVAGTVHASSSTLTVPLSASSSSSSSSSSSINTSSAAATPSSTSASDPLAAVLTLHSLDIASGHSQGAADGLAKAVQDASETGARRGRDMAGELGFYAGFLQTCTLLHAANPQAYPDRVWSRAARLRASMLRFPLYASGFDPHTLDDGVAFVALRNSFKLLLSQMGFAQYFLHEAPNPQSISF